MTFEEIIYQRFSSLEYFSEVLAQYAGCPAVFYQEVPDDKQDGWEGEQYPRIAYTIDMQADEERKSAGVMQVDLYCDETKTLPEDIEPHIKACLKNLLVKPEGNSHYAFAWARTEMFVMNEKNFKQVNTRIIGATLRFDILEYNLQETTNPDPAKALMHWLKELNPECLVIGEDIVDTFYEPSGERPAFYVRVQSHKTNRATYALTWLDYVLSIHVIAPEPEHRSIWSRYLADCLNRAGEVIMLDDSPMLVWETAVDNATDYLTRGQITVKAQYSLPRVMEYVHPLNQINTNQKGGEKMAIKKSTEAVQAVETTEVVTNPIDGEKNEATGNQLLKKQAVESVYTVNEFVKAAATAFDKPYSPDIIRAAMKMAGKTKATKSEAENIIKKFL